MDLSERKKRILKAVVSENIRTAEPVSSLELQKEYLQNVSSATIRNELAALEEMGFLIQPHTSSGRIPTVEGYKKYISELMTEQKLSRLESEKIRETINNRISNIEQQINRLDRRLRRLEFSNRPIPFGINTTDTDFNNSYDNQNYII